MIYLYNPADGGRKNPSAEYIRQHAGKVISLGFQAGEKDTVTFWDQLRWDNAKNDPKIKRRAGRLTMVIDLYVRTQPNIPERLRFETLYGTKQFLYSDECDYLELKPPVSTYLNSYLR